MLNLSAIVEEAVEKSYGCLKVYRVEEDGKKPAQCDHVDKFQLHQTFIKLRQLAGNEISKDALVDKCADDFHVVVIGQQALADRHQQPESLFKAFFIFFDTEPAATCSSPTNNNSTAATMFIA